MQFNRDVSILTLPYRICQV